MLSFIWAPFHSKHSFLGMRLSRRLPCQKGSEALRSTSSLPPPSNGLPWMSLWKHLEDFWITRTHNSLWFGLFYSWARAHSLEAQFWISHTQLKQSRRSNRPHLSPLSPLSVWGAQAHMGHWLTLVNPCNWVQRKCSLDIFRSFVALGKLFNLSEPQSPHPTKVILLHTSLVGVGTKRGIYTMLRTLMDSGSSHSHLQSNTTLWGEP